jgi:Fic family protein
MPPQSRITGTYQPQPGGFKAFLPRPLPPEPNLRFDQKLSALLSEADRAVAGLDSATDLLPNPDRFVYAYVRREAVLSSQIEGTQSSLDDLIRREAGAPTSVPDDVNEVSNYVAALNTALERLSDLPVSGRLIREAHAVLMRGVRGNDRTPGEFRRHQVHIGPEGATIQEAVFVPPPADAVPDAMAALERYLHETPDMDAPPLVRIALAHAQFETIHPFGDGNGRCGRLLIGLLLAETGLLRRPVLYLSAFFRARKTEYYDRLQATRDQGDFENWLAFFLEGVRDTARDALDRARRIIALRQAHQQVIVETLGTKAAKALRLLDRLYQRPATDITMVKEELQVSFPTASAIVARLEAAGILLEITGRQRRRIYLYQPYIEIFT